MDSSTEGHWCICHNLNYVRDFRHLLSNQNIDSANKKMLTLLGRYCFKVLLKETHLDPEFQQNVIISMTETFTCSSSSFDFSRRLRVSSKSIILYLFYGMHNASRKRLFCPMLQGRGPETSSAKPPRLIIVVDKRQ